MPGAGWARRRWSPGGWRGSRRRTTTGPTTSTGCSTEAYERCFAAEGETGERLLAILRLLGLFDRPAGADCLAALRRPPAIPGLTEAIAGLSEGQWTLSVTRLVDCGLVAAEAGTLDAHPLVREHFGRQLRSENPAGCKAAHGRLFDHLKETTEYWPDTLAGLQPLYQAILHGCRAGRHEEARAEVYRDRILRGTADDGFFSTKQLGALGADLGAVACFFEPPWSRVSPVFTDAAQAWLLNEAAFRLRSLGRLTEAVEAMRLALQIAVKQEVWGAAARGAYNLIDKHGYGRRREELEDLEARLSGG